MELRRQRRTSLSPGTMQEWTYEFDATLLPQPIQDQFYPTVVSVTAPGASNNPQSKTVMVEVKNPATPMFVINMAGVGPVPVEEPRFAPEQFAATGGGETFAAAAPNVIGDPPFDAALDFDNLLDDVGSPEITARNVDLFKNLPPLQEGEDLATAGRKPFDVYVDFSHTGTFTKTFYLLFSDEDLPGARPPESIVRTLTYTFIVVPEPASVVLIALGVCVFGATTIRGSRQRYVAPARARNEIGLNRPVAYNSSSSSPTNRSNRVRAVSTGAGLVMSTPASFKRSSGHFEQPPLRNDR